MGVASCCADSTRLGSAPNREAPDERREPGPIYNVRYDKVPLAEVANSERAFPPEWISGDGTDVSDEFVRYARPLIGDDWPSLPLVEGRLRLARLQPIFAGQKLPLYVPQADRK